VRQSKIKDGVATSYRATRDLIVGIVHRLRRRVCRGCSLVDAAIAGTTETVIATITAEIATATVIAAAATAVAASIAAAIAAAAAAALRTFLPSAELRSRSACRAWS